MPPLRRLARFAPAGLLATLTCAIAFVSPSASAAAWVELGPSPINSGSAWGGRIVALAVHPTDADILYAGAASGGVWKWDGDTWTPLTDGLPSASIGAIALDPDDPDTVYVGTGEPTYCSCCYAGLGIYKSTDGGATWTHYAEDDFGGRSVTQIAVSTKTGEVFASTMPSGEPKEHPKRGERTGLYKSTDGGETWEVVENGLPDQGVSDFAFSPDNADIMYVGVASPVLDAAPPESGMYKSTDGGATFSKISSGFTSDPKKIAIAVSPVDPDRLYVLAGGASPSVYVSSNGGDSWTARKPDSFSAQINGHYDLCAIADPNDVDTAYFGGVQMVRTTNGGSSFSRITPSHTDIQRLAFDADGNLIVGQDGGVHVSSNGGGNWSTRNRGLATVQIYAGGALNSSDPQKMVGGLQDNGTVYRGSDDLEWEMVLGGDGGCNASHPDTPDVVFAEIYSAGNIYRSTNGGRSFQKSGNGINTGDRTSFLPPFVYHPGDPDVLFYGTQRIWKTSNRGSSWQAISGDVAGGDKAIRSIGVSDDAEWMYVTTTAEQVHVSSDGGATFTKVLDDIHGPRTLSKQIRVAPWDPQTAYLAVWSFETDQVQMTTDGGQTWTSVKGNLPDVPANTTEAFEIGETKVVLTGTDRGIYAMCDDDAKWRVVGEDFPTVPVVDVQFDAANDRLVAFTFGRGALTMPDADQAFWTELCEQDPGDDDDGDDDDTGGDDDDGDDDDGDDDDGDDDDGDDDDDDGDDDDNGDDDDGGDDDDDGGDDDGDDDDDDDDTGEDDGHADGGEDDGCGCTAASGGQGALGGVWLAALVGLARRRRAAAIGVIAMGLVASGCGGASNSKQEQSTEPVAEPAAAVTPAPTPVDAAQSEADAVHDVAAAPGVAAGLRLAGPGTSPGGLLLRVDQPLTLVLDEPPTGPTVRTQSPAWSDRELQRFVVQLPEGEQESVTMETRLEVAELGYTFRTAGTSVLLFCTEDRPGPHRERSFVYCNKTVVRVADRQGRIRPAPGIVAGKSGEPVEIRALMAPDRIVVGSVMPVRVYMANQNPIGQTVRAIRPDGSIQTHVTTEKGIATIEVDQPGRWIVRVEGTVDNRDYMGDLVFETPRGDKI